jgi:hypothetical protein
MRKSKTIDLKTTIETTRKGRKTKMQEKSNLRYIFFRR